MSRCRRRSAGQERDAASESAARSSFGVIRIAIIACVGGFAGSSYAQCSPRWIGGVGDLGTNGVVYALCVHDPDGEGPGSPLLIVGGAFAQAGGAPAGNIASWNIATGQWSSLGSGLGGSTLPSVGSLASIPNQTGGRDLVAAGNFVTAGGLPANGVARWDGQQWHAMGPGLPGINDLSVSPTTGQVFAAAGVGIHLWDGTAWTNLANANDLIRTLVVSGQGDVFVGGDWSTVTTPLGIRTSRRLARWNGTAWAGMAEGVAGPVVYDLALTPDGKVAVGGFFFSAGPLPAPDANGLTIYDPSQDTFTAFGSVNNSVNAILVMLDGSIVAGGTMVAAGSGQIPISRVVLWSQPGTSDAAYDAMEGGTGNTVNALVRLPDGDVVAGGSFITAGGLTAKRVARYSFALAAPAMIAHPQPATVCAGDDLTLSVTAAGSEVPLFAWRRDSIQIDPLINPTAATATLVLTDLATSATYDCLVTNSCGSTTSLPALVNVIAPCGPADIAGPGQAIGCDGELTADDIIVFIGWFFASDDRADVAGPGQVTSPDAEFTADDIIVFLNAFFAGC